MPATALHIGIPGLLSFYRPKKIDIFSGVLGSIIIDVDFFLFLLIGTPLHGFSHTFLGATLIGILLVIIVQSIQKYVIKIKKWFDWKLESDLRSITLGSFVGVYSHVILDSFLYRDIKPFYPLNENPLYFEAGHDMIFILVYAVAGITTLILLALYCWSYYKSSRDGATSPQEP